MMNNQATTQGPRASSWREYNRSVCQRGSLRVWIDPHATEVFARPQHDGSRGRPRKYSDALILMLATVQQVYHLRLRQTIGMVASLLELLNVEHDLPDYSTFCRRRQQLKIPVRTSCGSHSDATSEPQSDESGIVLLIDSTGIKMLGEGEWIVSHRGLRRYRQWRLLHLAINADTLEILSAEVSASRVRDHQVVEALLEQIPEPIDSIIADGAYDRQCLYQLCQQRNAWPVIPPSIRARIWRHGNCSAAPHPRDVNLRYMRQHGRSAWYTFSGYHTRSLAETTMQRLKTVFGDRNFARRIEAQRVELLIRCRALNMMTRLGLPPPATN